VVAWGAEGAAYLERGGRACRVPAHVPRIVVDTLGAGDVFNAGVIHGLTSGQTLHQCVAEAVLRAGRKCERAGLI
jgi:ketohexokinase